MEKVTLWCHCGPGGKSDTNLAKVADVALPPFVTRPDVVQWGVRTFKLETAPDGTAQYVECFAVIAIKHFDHLGNVISSL